MERREFLGLAAISLLAGCVSPAMKETITMEDAYGIIGQMKTFPGKRSEVIAALIEGTADMPGNLAYMIAEDTGDDNSIWITEVWRTKTDHANSLQLPGVQAAIAKARAHISGFGTRVETKPILRG